MLTIGQVARRAGIRTSTLCYYESTGLLPAPTRLGGQRRYGEEVFRQLALIGLAQRAGFTIAQIHTLLHGFPEITPASERWQVLAAPKLAEVQALMQRLLEMQDALERTLKCRCAALEDCVTACN
jgi:MerR family transcriptional regulator, redox-sensitive transcriptional activator SoxR